MPALSSETRNGFLGASAFSREGSRVRILSQQCWMPTGGERESELSAALLMRLKGVESLLGAPDRLRREIFGALIEEVRFARRREGDSNHRSPLSPRRVTSAACSASSQSEPRPTVAFGSYRLIEQPADTYPPTQDIADARSRSSGPPSSTVTGRTSARRVGGGARG